MGVVTAVLHAVAGVVAAGFAYDVGRSFAVRRSPSSFWWTLALALFAFCALADAVAAFAGWSAWLYRLWYVGAAWLVAAFGLGTAYLSLPRQVARVLAVVLSVIGLAMLVVAARAPVDTAVLEPGLAGGQAWVDGTVRRFSPLLTVPGSLLLLGGALASWWRTRHPYALWLLAGTLFLSSGGALTRLGVPAALPAANLVGVWMLYRGHRLARQARSPRQAGDVATPAEGPAH